MKMANEEVHNFDFSEPIWSNQPEEVRQFIQNCVQKDVSKRMDVHQLMHLPLLKLHREMSKIVEVNH